MYKKLLGRRIWAKDIKVTNHLFVAKKAGKIGGEEPSFWEKPITEHSEDDLVETIKNFVIGARTEKGAAFQPMSRSDIVSEDIQNRMALKHQVTHSFSCLDGSVSNNLFH